MLVGVLVDILHVVSEYRPRFVRYMVSERGKPVPSSTLSTIQYHLQEYLKIRKDAHCESVCSRFYRTDYSTSRRLTKRAQHVQSALESDSKTSGNKDLEPVMELTQN